MTVAILGFCLLAACVNDTKPSNCAEPSVRIEVTVAADSMNPAKIGVCRDQEVTLVISAGVDGFLHIHGYDEVVGVTEIVAGSTKTLDFNATRAGQFPIELHPGTDPQGVDVGTFTVYEP